MKLKDPIEGVGNVSSDGTMILIREEGWKEVKMATFSQVEVLEPANERRRRSQREGKRKQEDVVRLSDHSYCAGVWDADTFGAYQYASNSHFGTYVGHDLPQANVLCSLNRENGSKTSRRRLKCRTPSAFWPRILAQNGENPRLAHEKPVGGAA